MRANVSEGYRGTPYRRPLRKDGPWRPQGQSGIRSIRSIEISLSNNLVKRADEEGKLHLAQVREILEEAYPVAGTEPRNYLDSPWAWRPAHP